MIWIQGRSYVCPPAGKKGLLPACFAPGLKGYKAPGIGLSLEEKSRPLPVAKALHLPELAHYDLQVIIHHGRG